MPVFRLQPERGKGFTIIELLLVLGIMGIMMGLVAAGVASAMRTRHINHAARGISVQLQLARRMAIARNQVVHVRLRGGPTAAAQSAEIYLFLNATSRLGSVPQTVYDAEETYVNATGDDSRIGPSITIENQVRFNAVYGAVYFWPDGSAGQAVDTGEGESAPLPEIDLVDADGQHRFVRIFQATGRVEIRNPDVEP